MFVYSPPPLAEKGVVTKGAHQRRIVVAKLLRVWMALQTNINLINLQLVLQLVTRKKYT
jgi:hypothetical protein